MEALGQMGRVQQVHSRSRKDKVLYGISTSGGGNPLLQCHEGQPHGVPGQVRQQQEGCEGGGYQGVLRGNEEEQEDESRRSASKQLQIVLIDNMFSQVANFSE